MKDPKPKLLLDWATHEAAKYACENWHYSQCLPAGKSVKIGVWESAKFTGVVIFSLGATPNLSKPYGLSMTECCELTRVALRTHETPVSRIVAIAIKKLKQHCSGTRLVVSFADRGQGHHGGIYQAGNWLYSGAVELETWIIGGKRMHPRSVVAKYGTQAQGAVQRIDPNARKVWGFKHRYLMPLDEEIRRRIEPLQKPYPKRAESKANVAPVHQTGEGGVTPTSALQQPIREDGVKWSSLEDSHA